MGMADNDNASGFGALLAGLGVGLVLGFLFAPQSGEETREIIVERTKEGMAVAADAMEELKSQAELAVVNAAEAVQCLKQRAEQAVAEAQEKIQEAVREGQDAYRNEFRERQAQADARPLHSVRNSS
jgi:gas vesicle protein